MNHAPDVAAWSWILPAAAGFGVAIVLWRLLALRGGGERRRLAEAIAGASQALGDAFPRRAAGESDAARARACLEALTRQQLDVRERENLRGQERAVLAEGSRTLVAQVEACLNRAGDRLPASGPEGAQALSLSARHLAASGTELSSLIAESSLVTSRSTDCQEKESVAMEKLSNAAREIARDLGREADLGERMGELALQAHGLLGRARLAAGKSQERLADLQRRAHELPAVGDRLSSAGQSCRFLLGDIERETGTLLGVLLQAGTQVEDLGKRCEEVGTILEFLGNVAEETNLLALNAAIIAAEAGPEGRGFAVVAEEIRELAERMASSTKESVSLIDSVRQGVREAQATVARGSDRSGGARKMAQRAVASMDQLVKDADAAAHLAGAAGSGKAEAEPSGDDATLLLREAGEAAGDLARLREELRREQERVRHQLDEMQQAAASAGAAVAEQSMTTAELAGHLTRMHDLALPLQRAADHQHALEEQLGQRLQVWESALADIRTHLAAFGRACVAATRLGGTAAEHPALSAPSNREEELLTASATGAPTRH